MRKCRGFLRLFPAARIPYLTTVLKIMTVFCIILTIFLYVQEKYEKEALIDLALGSRVASDLVKHDNDTLILDGLFDTKQKVRNAFVVIVVTSLPENLARRNMIRNTWASRARDHGITVVFFLGRPASEADAKSLIKEARQYKDIVIDDFSEGYYALAIKTLRLLKYFRIHHPKSKFLVKTDDDVFVNVSNLVHYCYAINRRFEEVEGVKRDEDAATREYFVGGVIHSDRGPHTWNPFTKWYVPPDLWESLYKKVLEERKKVEGEGTWTSPSMNKDSYPPYAEGNFYVLSSDAVVDILNVSKTVPLYHLEDIHVTGVLASWLLKIDLESMPFISSSSNLFPKMSYFWYKWFTAGAKDLIAFHCDNHVELISLIYGEQQANQ